MSTNRKFNLVANVEGEVTQIVYTHIIGNDDCTMWFGNCLAVRNNLSGKNGDLHVVEKDVEGLFKIGEKIGRVAFGDVISPGSAKYLDYIKTPFPVTQYSIEVMKDVKIK